MNIFKIEWLTRRRNFGTFFIPCLALAFFSLVSLAVYHTLKKEDERYLRNLANSSAQRIKSSLEFMLNERLSSLNRMAYAISLNSSSYPVWTLAQKQLRDFGNIDLIAQLDSNFKVIGLVEKDSESANHLKKLIKTLPFHKDPKQESAFFAKIDNEDLILLSTPIPFLSYKKNILVEAISAKTIFKTLISEKTAPKYSIILSHGNEKILSQKSTPASSDDEYRSILPFRLGNQILTVSISPTKEFFTLYQSDNNETILLLGLAMSIVLTLLIYFVLYSRWQKTILTTWETRKRSITNDIKTYAIFNLDSHGIITSWNTGAQSLKQYKEHEVIGKHFEIFYTSADRAANVPFKQLQLATSTGVFETIAPRVRKDGSEFMAHTIIRPVFDSKFQQLSGFVQIVNDEALGVIEKYDLEQSQLLLDVLIEQCPVGLVVVNSNGKITRFNKQIETIFGYSALELVDQPIEFLIDHNLKNKHVELRTQYMISPRARPMGSGFEVRGKSKSGDSLVLKISLTPFILNSETHVLAYVSDNTLRKLELEKFSELATRYQIVVEAAKMGTWDYDTIHDTAIWDKNMYDLYEMEPQRNLASTLEIWRKALIEADRYRATAEIQNALEGKSKLDTWFRIRCGPGKVKYLRSVGKLIFNEEGRPARLIGVNWEITREKEAEAKLRSLSKLMKLASRSEDFGAFKSRIEAILNA